MRQLQPVLWAKGTFLTPQHLQTHDRFLEGLLLFRFDALTFRPWGFAHLQVDHELLAAGSFAIQSASGVLPDGLLFDIPSSDEAPAPKLVTFGPDEDRVDIHLAIPAYRIGGRNVAGINGIDTRYSPQAILVRDETTGTSERALQVARRNFRLLTGAETRAGTPSLKVARINKMRGGVLQMDPQFVPALLNLSASELLLSILKRLVELLSARGSELSGLRGHKNQSLADFSTADIANFWLLYTVNSWLPEIRHIFEVRRGHPEHAFRTLTALAGALTTFSDQIHPRELPVYDHDELGACFTDLDELIRRLLKTVVPANFISLPLKLTRPFIYAASIDDDKYLKGSQLYLAITANMPEADLITKTPDFVKLCSAPHLDQLIRQALPGVPLRHLPAPPAVVPVKSKYQYFSLGQSGAAWEAIMRARSVAAHVPGEFSDPSLELLIVLPEGT